MPAMERIRTLQVPRPGPYDWHWVASHMLDHWQLDQNQPKSEIMKKKITEEIRYMTTIVGRNTKESQVLERKFSLKETQIL